MQFEKIYLNHMAEVFKTLGEVSRLHLVRQLMVRGESSVGDLVERTGLSQANVSKHLKMLAQAGLVSCRRDGNFVRYKVANPLVQELCGLCSAAFEREEQALIKKYRERGGRA